MTAAYPVILPAIVIDDSNDAIVMKEGAITEIVRIAHRTYFLSGDEEVDDLMTAFVAAADSHSNAVNPNTYSKSGSFLDGNPANKSGGITINKVSGTSTFQFLFSHADTTFDAALLGFDPTVDTADSTGQKTGTLSPSGWWVSPEVVAEIEPETEYDAWSTRTQSGLIYSGSRGEPFKVLRLGVDFVVGERTHEDLNEADPDASFSAVMKRLRSARYFELHLVDHAGGTLVAFMDSSTEHGSGWHLSQETLEDGFHPDRRSPAVDLYSWALRLWGRVA